MLFICFGVSGCGKSSVASSLASRLGATLIEADDFHSAANVQKMAQGSGLTDEDRIPWLNSVGHVVLACSCLKRSYRDLFRSFKPIFIHLKVSQDIVVKRILDRKGHFAGTGIVKSQFDALEEPMVDEVDVAEVDCDRLGLEQVCEAACNMPVISKYFNR